MDSRKGIKKKKLKRRYKHEKMLTFTTLRNAVIHDMGYIQYQYLLYLTVTKILFLITNHERNRKKKSTEIN